MRKTLAFIVLTFIYSGISAQKITAEQYIDTYKDIAIREMKRMGIPASITLAQGLLETESGNGDLVKRSNNHFGIKCKSNWSGSSVSHDDDENGECFRKYNSAEDSYRDHSNFLRGSERYASLFKLSPTDYKGWAYGLKKAGYATNPAYPAILIKSIEDYNLQQYTMMGLGEVPVFDASKYTDDKPETETTAIPVADNNVTRPTPTANDGNVKTQFNGLRAIYAANGTSLLAIATDYHIPLVKLLEYNDLEKDGLLTEDSWIFLEKKQAQANRDFYIPGKDESVHSIAQVNGIQLSSVLKYNNLKETDVVKAGTKILLRANADKGGVENKNTTADARIHEVQPKEGLYAIARKYNITVQDLREWNNLTSDDLKIGQKLIISK
ncbi:MAG: glucosaminidase domain-containing protein [Ferruginibacter sp.]